jgi:hypothetical protein
VEIIEAMERKPFLFILVKSWHNLKPIYPLENPKFGAPSCLKPLKEGL